MPSPVTIWLSTLFLTSAAFASPFIADRTVPSPVQNGISASCTQYYQAASGDYCDSVAKKYDVSIADFESWNPAVGSTCSQLLAGYYYCDAGGSTTGNAKLVEQPSPTASSSTVQTPTPVSTGSTESTGSTGSCAPAVPGWTDPNQGSNAGQQMVCDDISTANFDLCSQSEPCPGNATFYDLGTGVDLACGTSLGTFDNTKEVVALSQDYIMGPLSNDGGVAENPYCGTKITVTYQSVTKTFEVVDKCAGCYSKQHIDLSPAAYSALGVTPNSPNDPGHLEVSWFFDSA